jgi:hypothetical protein
VTRPTVAGEVLGADGKPCGEFFLIDSGADRTVFSAHLLRKLQFTGNHQPPGFALVGVSGPAASVLLTTVIEFIRDDGGPVWVRGTFAAFTDPNAVEMSVLGRDVLNNFDLIVSRPRNEVLLLAPNHHYQVVQH